MFKAKQEISNPDPVTKIDTNWNEILEHKKICWMSNQMSLVLKWFERQFYWGIDRLMIFFLHSMRITYILKLLFNKINNKIDG